MKTATYQRPPAPTRRRHQMVVKLPAAVLAALLLAAPPLAAAEAADVRGVSATTAVVVDVDAIAAHVNEAVAVAMAEHEAPGGVFVLVADGQVAIAEGFGQTSLIDGEAVDPARTRFDVGSVAKLVTATAVMQQVEQGRLDLDEDVNTYLAASRSPIPTRNR